MSLTSFFSRIRLLPRDAEVIFDRTEPIGQPSDLILPSRRWFRRDKTRKLPGSARTRTASVT